MVIRTVKPDDAGGRLRKGTFITIHNAKPEPAWQSPTTPLMHHNEQTGMLEPVMVANNKLCGWPLRVRAYDWPYVVCEAIVDTGLMAKGQIVKVDARFKEIAYVSKAYVEAFES